MAVKGLIYIPDFISGDQETDLVSQIDKNEWDTSISRRRQQYGIAYDIQKRNVGENLVKVPPVPEWLAPIVQRICDGGYMTLAEQVIVNEYIPGQGISAHIDSKVFGDVVVSVSLLSSIPMRFERCGETYTQVLEPRSLVVLSGDARYEWTHSILRKDSDVISGRLTPRKRRVSITLRTLKVK